MARYSDDICPLMSIGKAEPVYCTADCAWFDTELEECSVSVINGSLKSLRHDQGFSAVETIK